MCFAHMYMCIPHVCLVPMEAKKRALDPQTRSYIVRYHVGAGNQTQVLVRVASALNLLSSLFSQM